VKDRNKELISIRIDLKLPVDDSEKADMIIFQNKVLRPILKFQHPSITSYFLNYVKGKKVNIENLTKPEIITFIKQSLLRDQKLKTYYCGLISALFTTEETQFYLNNKREINKRLTSMMIERIIDFIL